MPELYEEDGSALAPSVDLVVHVAPPTPTPSGVLLRRSAGVAPDADQLGASLASTAAKLAIASQPRILGVSPHSGPLAGGTRVTLTGSGLGASKDDVLNLTIGGRPCA